ncbi:MAG: ABC transporter permease [Alphaproteobacteria bacterium]
MVFVFVFFSIFGGTTFIVNGISSWLNVAATLGIVALPIGFLMIAGELDISVGAMMPAGAMILGIVSGFYELPIPLGIAITMAFAALVGWVNGMIVVRTAVPSLIVTMGTLFAVAGVTLFMSLLLTDSTRVALAAPAWAKAVFGEFYLGGYQVIIVWWLALIALCMFFLHFSPWGNWLYALGGDKVSARNAGIPTRRLTIGLFMLSSMCATFAGFCQTLTFNSAQTSTNFALIFNSIISVVVGGVLLTGGFGSVIGIVFGTVTFAMVTQGISYTDFDRNLSNLIIGVMLLIAVLMNNTFRRMALSYAGPKKR